MPGTVNVAAATPAGVVHPLKAATGSADKTLKLDSAIGFSGMRPGVRVVVAQMT